MSTFKENWLKTDECCENCGQVIKKQKGITKQSVKRLFSFKFTLDEFIWTAVIIMVILSAYAYQHDIQVCKDYAKNIEQSWMNMSNGSYNRYQPSSSMPQLDYFMMNDSMTKTNDTEV